MISESIESRLFIDGSKLDAKASPSYVLEVKAQGCIIVFFLHVFHYKTHDGEHEYFSVRASEKGRYLPCFKSGKKRSVIPKQTDSDTAINKISVYIDNDRRECKLAPVGNIIMNPKGAGLGRYLLSYIVTFLKKEKPEYRFVKGLLGAGDAASASNRARRHRFYEGAGFAIHYKHERISGVFFAENVSKLKDYYDADKFKLISLDSFIKEHFDLFNSESRLSEAHQKRLDADLKKRASKAKAKNVLNLLGGCSFFCFALYFLVNAF